MFTQEKATELAHQWVEAWNKHNLEEILAHYSHDVEFYSPFVVKLLNNPSGQVKGIDQLKFYFKQGLEAYPELKFDLHYVLAGVQSITIVYQSVKNLSAAEVMFLDQRGKVNKVYCHYTSMQSS